MAKTRRSSSLVANIRIGRRQLINLGVILLLLYAILPRLGKFTASFEAIRHGHLVWAIAALGFAVGTSLIASLILIILAKSRLRYSRTLIVQFASLFANRLLPGGIGSIGVNYQYLRHNRYSKESAGAVIATIALIGFLGHILLLSIISLTIKTNFSGIVNFHIKSYWYWLALLVILALVMTLFWFKKLRDEVIRTALGTYKNLLAYKAQPLKILSALLASVGLTALYTLCLLSSAQAVGVHLAFGQVLIVLTAGVAAATITPTPGGLLGAEAGLFAGLVAYRVSSPEALAIVLIYRFITYWLPLVVGAIFWGIVVHGDYL